MAATTIIQVYRAMIHETKIKSVRYNNDYETLVGDDEYIAKQCSYNIIVDESVRRSGRVLNV